MADLTVGTGTANKPDTTTETSEATEATTTDTTSTAQKQTESKPTPPPPKDTAEKSTEQKDLDTKDSKSLFGRLGDAAKDVGKAAKQASKKAWELTADAQKKANKRAKKQADKPVNKAVALAKKAYDVTMKTTAEVTKVEVTTIDFGTDGDIVVGRGRRDRSAGSRVIEDSYEAQAKTAKGLAESPHSTADAIISGAAKAVEITHLAVAGIEMEAFGAGAAHGVHALGVGGAVGASGGLPVLALGALLVELGHISQDIKAVGKERTYADSFSNGYAGALVLTDDGASAKEKQQALALVTGYAKTHGKDDGAALLAGYEEALKLSHSDREAARGELARFDAGSTKWGSGLGTSSHRAINENYKFGAYTYAMMGVWESNRY